MKTILTRLPSRFVSNTPANMCERAPQKYQENLQYNHFLAPERVNKHLIFLPKNNTTNEASFGVNIQESLNQNTQNERILKQSLPLKSPPEDPSELDERTERQAFESQVKWGNHTYTLKQSLPSKSPPEDPSELNQEEKVQKEITSPPTNLFPEEKRTERKIFQSQVKWGVHTYTLKQLLPSSTSSEKWEKVVNHYIALLKEQKDIPSGVPRLTLRFNKESEEITIEAPEYSSISFKYTERTELYNILSQIKFFDSPIEFSEETDDMKTSETEVNSTVAENEVPKKPEEILESIKKWLMENKKSLDKGTSETRSYLNQLEKLRDRLQNEKPIQMDDLFPLIEYIDPNLVESEKLEITQPEQINALLDVLFNRIKRVII